MKIEKNVFGEILQPCCTDPMTGFYRTGFCRVGPEDIGEHGACVVMTKEFLEFSKNQGNDLSTPHPENDFPGLKPGDKWCLCNTRWLQALDAGVAPKLVLAATHYSLLHNITLDELYEY